ncbi:MAG: homocysteine S-methyltransferase family protein [Candidatus Coatesbacteria bacterium]|nr:MAG: homocysteine S-methyltransferase family protein [Candidatus Coatesbacteria bacterium]
MNRAELLTELESKVFVADGAMGSLLSARGLPAGMVPDWFNLENPDAVLMAHREYVKAGAGIIFTNTFCASRRRLAEFGLADDVGKINEAGVKLAREPAGERTLIAGDIGPSGEYVLPVGSQTFGDAYDNFREQAEVLAKGKVDLIVVETMSDTREMKAALMAVRDVFDGPVLASMTFSEGDRTVTGTPPSVAAVVMDAMGADIIGANCSGGPEGLTSVIAEMACYTSRPLAVMPNAGLPRLDGEETVWDMGPKEFGEFGPKFAELCASVIGGCCGTTPAHIRELSRAVSGLEPAYHETKGRTFLASRMRVVEVGVGVTVIGERINPTSRADLTTEITEGKLEIIRTEIEKQTAAGADVIDINVGVPGVDEVEAMNWAASFADRATPLPLSIDSSDPDVLEAGLRTASGKPLLNSISGEPEKLEALLPLAKRFGAAFVGLTLDGNGIPDTVEGRLSIAERIVDTAINSGITVENILIDTLMMTAAQADPSVTLDAVRLSRDKLGVKTVLGISNVSHGLPGRSALNAGTLLAAAGKGLDAAIVNPYDPRVAEALSIIRVIQGGDPGARTFLKAAKSAEPKAAPAAELAKVPGDMLYEAVLLGYRDRVGELVGRLLDDGVEPVAVNDRFILPALEEVGRRFEKKEYFLPEVILSAEAVQEAFNVLEPLFEKDANAKVGGVVFATVEGDVHDIGKNIVSAVMRGHGFVVRDLGKNVPADAIVEAAGDADIVALSALMTTTMPEMGKVAESLSEAGIEKPIIIGGAVVDGAYASKIGAYYAPDAVGAVKIAKEVLGKA